MRILNGCPRNDRWSIPFGLLLTLSLAGFLVPSMAAGEDSDKGLVSEKPATGRFVETDRGFMVPYIEKIPGTDVAFEMIPIPGGTFLLGSPSDEAGHQAHEGPQIKVHVEPFWIAKTETRWAEYAEFMSLYQIFKKFEAEKIRVVGDKNLVDAITVPTELYEPSFTYEYGNDPDQAAVTMTQYAAKQYSKWMSAVTGRQYRLPAEAEWEYACRAGTTTRWSFGNDPDQLGDYAWYADNCGEGGQKKVAQKKPNPWGLYDMHGNVAEWVLDEYREDGYAWLKGKKNPDAWETIAWPDEPWPRTVRGGSWESDAAGCRSAAKLGSHDIDWKANDPNLPLSPWWFTDDPARGVGFRLVRSLKVIPRMEMEKFWKIDCTELKEDVDYRLEEGRGVIGIVDKNLPKAIQNLKKQ